MSRRIHRRWQIVNRKRAYVLVSQSTAHIEVCSRAEAQPAWLHRQYGIPEVVRLPSLELDVIHRDPLA